MITIHRAYTKEELTIPQAKRLLTAAKKVLECALSGKIKEEDRGICGVLRMFAYSVEDPLPPLACVALVCRSATRWKHEASVLPGSYTVYPILEVIGYDKWEGPNLEARISLLRYVIKRLRDAIRRAEKNGKATIR